MAIHSIICKSCGSNEFKEQNGMYVCQICGTKHYLSEDGNSVNIYVDALPLTVDEQYAVARDAYEHGNYQQALRLYSELNTSYRTHWEPVYYISLLHFLTFTSNTDFLEQRKTFIASLPELLEMIKSSYDVTERRPAVIMLCSEFYGFCEKLDRLLDERDKKLRNLQANVLNSRAEIRAEILAQRTKRREAIMLANEFRNFILAEFAKDDYLQKIAYMLISHIVDVFMEYFGDLIEMDPCSENFFWQCFKLLREDDQLRRYKRYGIGKEMESVSTL